MKNIDDILVRYLAVWNDPDPVRRQAEIEELWTDDAVYNNAASEYRGHRQIAEGIGRSHDAWVGTGHTFVPAGKADTHHLRARFVWHMYDSQKAEPVSIGTNFMVFSDDLRIAGDFQFIDK
jgi:hypothetical protein